MYTFLIIMNLNYDAWLMYANASCRKSKQQHVNERLSPESDFSAWKIVDYTMRKQL